MDQHAEASGTIGESKRRNPNGKRKKSSRANMHATLIFHPIFLALFGLLALALCISFYLVMIHPDVGESLVEISERELEQQQERERSTKAPDAPEPDAPDPPSSPHLFPKFPILPVFSPVPDGDTWAQQLLQGKPTMAGMLHLLQTYQAALHRQNLDLAKKNAEPPELIEAYFNLTKSHLKELEEKYRGENIFSVREDESIYLSLAAFREHLLTQTMQSAFDQAAHPERLFVGAVVQNCFGIDGRTCKTGMQVYGKGPNGHDLAKISDAPPDVNGVEEFCKLEKYQKYCDAGQIRVLYVHDTDALGPAVARFYASRLWGGETYFLQMDAHLEFAPRWDDRYIAEVRAAKAFPKSILSAYPPGFQEFGNYEGGSPGARLCTCEFSDNDVEDHIIRINTGGNSNPDAPRPSQIAFIAAGFFFARSEFIKDVPFDPYVPWCFMGEEIALSMRAWTWGWDIYAPRQNLIAHQYRPGRMGLPKFWESVGRESGRLGLNTRLQKHVLRRIKHLVGYPTDTQQAIEEAGDAIVLTDYDQYALGTLRTREAYLELTKIDVVEQKCHTMEWCNKGTME